jgi:hypothetical protein
VTAAVPVLQILFCASVATPYPFNRDAGAQGNMFLKKGNIAEQELKIL